MTNKIAVSKKSNAKFTMRKQLRYLEQDESATLFDTFTLSDLSDLSDLFEVNNTADVINHYAKEYAF